MIPEDAFYFTELNPESPNLNLMIDPPQKFDYSILAIAGEIARPVKAVGRITAEGIRNESLGGQFRAVPISARHSLAADV
jgi:hypothetical protein